VAFVVKDYRSKAIPYVVAALCVGSAFIEPPKEGAQPLKYSAKKAKLNHYFGTHEIPVAYFNDAYESERLKDSKDVISRYTEFKVPEIYKKSFYSEVMALNEWLKFSKSKLASLLHVQRKSLYDWKDKPEVDVRNSTKKRLALLNSFVNQMDEEHRGLLGKVLFARESPISDTRKSVSELRAALFSDKLERLELIPLYDDLWSDFESLRFQGSYRKSHQV